MITEFRKNVNGKKMNLGKLKDFIEPYFPYSA